MNVTMVLNGKGKHRYLPEYLKWHIFSCAGGLLLAVGWLCCVLAWLCGALFFLMVKTFTTHRRLNILNFSPISSFYCCVLTS